MKEKTEKKELDRFWLTAAFFVVFFIIIVFRLADLQIVHGEEYNESSQNRVLKERTVKAPRGKILDRYGVPIATNRHCFTVQIVKTDVGTADMNRMLLSLAELFEKNGDIYFDSLNKYIAMEEGGFGGRSLDNLKSLLSKDNYGLNSDQKKELEAIGSFNDMFKFMREACFKIDPSLTDEEAYKIMRLRFEVIQNKWYFDTGSSIMLARNVKNETVAEIEEKHHLFPGVTTDIEPIRKYMDAGIASHVIGYMGAISQEQLNVMQEEGYGQNDIIGQAGIEKWAERSLKGTDGKKKIEVDTNGRLREELEGNPAQPGHDLVLTIDMKLQRVAVESLARNIEIIRKNEARQSNNLGDANAGSVVALDVNTGEVLVMANYPGYEPSAYLDSSENAESRALINQWNSDEENKPLRNRAIQDIYAPGSTFKPMTAIAALEEKVITPDTIIRDTGKMNIAGMDFYCLEYRQGWGVHGNLNLKKALETSCNIYFHKIGYDTGVDNLEKWARYFGLGGKTGIDLDFESAGILATREYKRNQFNNDIWRGADTAQAAIGQLYNKFTPLQMANYIATLANGGKRYTPHVIKEVLKYDGSVANEVKPQFEQIPIDQKTIDAVKEGMIAVTQSIDGTAAKVFQDFPYQVAGKTGTAQTGLEDKYSSNALFVCYAPADDPKIAVAVVVEKGAWGSNAAPIARDVLAEYFGLNDQSTADSSIKPEDAVFAR